MKQLLLLLLTVSIGVCELKIFTNEEPPQQYTQNGELTGIGVDIVKEIQKRVNNKDKISVYSWPRAIAIVKRTPNTVLFLAGKTEDRLPFLNFVGPILKKTYKLYGHKDTEYDIDSLEDAKQVNRISCVLDDVREVFLRTNNFKNLTYGEDHSRALDILLSKKCNLWASSDWENKIQMRNKNLDPALIKPVVSLYKSYNYIAFNNKTDTTIINKWQEALDSMKKDGTMEKIAKKWSKILKLDLRYIKEFNAIGIKE